MLRGSAAHRHLKVWLVGREGIWSRALLWTQQGLGPGCSGAGCTAEFLANTRAGAFWTFTMVPQFPVTMETGFWKGTSLKKWIETETCALSLSLALGFPWEQGKASGGWPASKPKLRFPFVREPQLNQQPIFPQIRAETTRAVKSAGKTPKTAWEEPKPVSKSHSVVCPSCHYVAHRGQPQEMQ